MKPDLIPAAVLVLGVVITTISSSIFIITCIEDLTVLNRNYPVGFETWFWKKVGKWVFPIMGIGILLIILFFLLIQK